LKQNCCFYTGLDARVSDEGNAYCDRYFTAAAEPGSFSEYFTESADFPKAFFLTKRALFVILSRMSAAKKSPAKDQFSCRGFLELNAD